MSPTVCSQTSRAHLSQRCPVSPSNDWFNTTRACWDCSNPHNPQWRRAGVNEPPDRQVSSSHRDSAAAVSLLIQEAARTRCTVQTKMIGGRVLLLEPLLVDWETGRTDWGLSGRRAAVRGEEGGRKEGGRREEGSQVRWKGERAEVERKGK